MTIDYPDYATPQAHATAISTTGVPLLHFPSNLNASGPITVPAATVAQIVPLNSNNVNPMSGFLSYEIRSRFTSNSASAIPFLTFILEWCQDAAATVALYRETWTVAANALSGGTTVLGAGPVRGAFLRISVTNEDPTNSMTINSLFVTVGSRPFPHLSPDWRTNNPLLSIPAYTAPNFGNASDNVLGAGNALSVPANSHTKLIFGLFAGTAQLVTSVTGTGVTAQLTPQVFVSGSGVVVFAGASPIVLAAAGNNAESLILPRSNLIIDVFNQSATNPLALTYSVCAASSF